MYTESRPERVVARGAVAGSTGKGDTGIRLRVERVETCGRAKSDMRRLAQRGSWGWLLTVLGAYQGEPDHGRARGSALAPQREHVAQSTGFSPYGGRLRPDRQGTSAQRLLGQSGAEAFSNALDADVARERLDGRRDRRGAARPSPPRHGHRTGRGTPTLRTRRRARIRVGDEDQVIPREGPFGFLISPERARISAERTRGAVLPGQGPTRRLDETCGAQLGLLLSALLGAPLNPATPLAEPRLRRRFHRSVGRVVRRYRGSR